ncbi:MAG: hypothetical protein JKX85_14810, partial [Phycisphaeraceae bacterium]|nr:hypothetical protein [Phycisphaeraceae bacterium]
AERIAQAQKRRRNELLFLIDLAVPRNVEAQVEKLNGVYVYDVDALGKIVADNKEYRVSQMPLCEKILDHEIDMFEQWLGESRLGPLIEQIYSDAKRLRNAELDSIFASCPDFTSQQRDAVTLLADRLTGKFMHPCVTTVRTCRLSRPTTVLVDELHQVAERSVVSRKKKPSCKNAVRK